MVAFFWAVLLCCGASVQVIHKVVNFAKFAVCNCTTIDFGRINMVHDGTGTYVSVVGSGLLGV